MAKQKKNKGSTGGSKVVYPEDGMGKETFREGDRKGCIRYDTRIRNRNKNRRMAVSGSLMLVWQVDLFCDLQG